MRPLRICASAALLLMIAGCGGDSTAPAETGTLIFHGDVACPSTTVEITVDDVIKGQYALNPNTTVQSFTVSAGNHSASVRQVGGTGVWPKVNFIVDPNQTYTIHLNC